MRINSKKKSSLKRYEPNLGFIGNARVDVANYLFTRAENRRAYEHAKSVANRILKEDVSKHYKESCDLTKFLKLRDLTFSKKTQSGEYKTFVVPCTTTIVPLQKSLFNEVEVASQKLLISLRKVLQDIYGSKTLRDSKFVKSLPESVRKIFIETIETSAQYYPQLHHKNMKDYPFFDNVGLDLVLVDDYLKKSNDFPKLIEKNKEDEIPGLPFKILELNAGSPSGASNNMNLLEGIYNQNPEILNSLGKVMPNDHFKVLGETYKSLGEDWTKREDGVQIILPPGGQNGAAPEIHQLAAYSGLIYTDADQLYLDNDGFIRLRTVSKNNPIVTAIYSRINSDSALFDPKKKLFLRDADSGEEIFLRDPFKLDKNGEAEIVKDENGKPIHLTSSYAIPGLINAIINKKIYMGGLNRVLDNKIILATLTHYAPKFFADEIKRLGIETSGPKIMPPQTLPPTKESVETIKKNPDEWVIKAPSLAGGQGVYIMKTLSSHKRKEVLQMITERPEHFAYQQLVKIGRIPVAVHRKEDGYRFANLAADIRMWVFFGGGKNALPKVTHNALVRYAPHEKGAMSSIVNTSAGGGYAPFVIVDDVNDKNSITPSELIKPKIPIPLKTELPVFVAAQMVQISRMIQDAVKKIDSGRATTYDLLGTFIGLKMQTKEILSFLHPRVIENIYKGISLLESKIQKREVAKYFSKISNTQLELVEVLSSLNSKIILSMRENLDNLRILNVGTVSSSYTDDERALDSYLLNELRADLKKNIKNKVLKKKLETLFNHIEESIFEEFPSLVIGKQNAKKLKSLLAAYCTGSKQRLQSSDLTKDFAELFKLNADVTELYYEPLFYGTKDLDKSISISTQIEMRSNKLLTETDFIAQNIKSIREEWLEVLKQSKKVKGSKDSFIAKERAKHLKKHPELKRMQEIINNGINSVDNLLELLPALPYAKFNIENFAREQKLTVREVFTSSLKANRISILSDEKIKNTKLANNEYAGECFSKKKNAHGLYSDSSIYIWIRESLDPFTALYTIGHEIIHYQQLKNSMNAEKRALKDGDLSMAKFLNYYGNFLSGNSRSIDTIDKNPTSTREVLYGYSDRLIKDFSKPIIKDLRKSLKRSDESWNKKLKKYGSLLGYMMPASLGTKVKALQEVMPAFENTKNIIFAKELGLEIKIDEVKAALPTANQAQIKEYKNLISQSAKEAKPNWEALRVIASHQYFGVNFHRAEREEDNLTLRPSPLMISVGLSYNQTQQQQ